MRNRNVACPADRFRLVVLVICTIVRKRETVLIMVWLIIPIITRCSRALRLAVAVILKRILYLQLLVFHLCVVQFLMLMDLTEEDLQDELCLM